MKQARKFPWLAIGLLATGIGVLLLLSFQGVPSIPVDAEAKIRFGMTEEQVVRILGASPGDYRTRTVVYGGLRRLPRFSSGRRNNREQPPCIMKAWTTNDGEIKVWFDGTGRVAGKVFNEPAVSVGWLAGRFEFILVKLGLQQPRTWCLN
jgi:hypothetical protein